VRSGRTAKLMSFSANRLAYCPSPSFSSQFATCCIAAPCSVGLWARRKSEFTRKITSREQDLDALLSTSAAILACGAIHSSRIWAGCFTYRGSGWPWRHFGFSGRLGRNSAVDPSASRVTSGRCLSARASEALALFISDTVACLDRNG
jgi:hypothetical protein